jgi:hypothetical protein
MVDLLVTLIRQAAAPYDLPSNYLLNWRRLSRLFKALRLSKTLLQLSFSVFFS